MIEALKSDELANRFGGRFKLCALVQRRLVQLMEGARPMVEREGRSDLELVIEELVQECRLALLKAATRWDPNRGAFTTCAQWWLRHAMGREPNSGTSGIEVPANAHKAEGTRDAAIRAHRMLSLDVPIGDNTDATFKDTLESPPDEAEFAPEDLDALPALIKRLPEAQRFAIERYYLADKTLQEVGDERGVTRARIGQLVDAGVAKLKRWMAQRERRP